MDTDMAAALAFQTGMTRVPGPDKCCHRHRRTDHCSRKDRQSRDFSVEERHVIRPTRLRVERRQSPRPVGSLVKSKAPLECGDQKLGKSF